MSSAGGTYTPFAGRVRLKQGTRHREERVALADDNKKPRTEQVRATIAHLGRLVERHAAGEYARAKALPEENPLGRSARAFLPRVAVSVIQLFQPLLIAPHIQIIKAPLPDTDTALAFNQLHDGAMTRG